MKYGLSDETIKMILEVFSRYPQIEKAVLYGSRAKGTFKNGSDIDLVVAGAAVDIPILNRINGDLDDLLLPYTFDLSILDFITNPELVDHIKRVGIVLYTRHS